MDAARQPIHRQVVAAGRSADRREDDSGGFRGTERIGPKPTFGSSGARPRATISIARSTFFVMAATFASTFFGFMREVVNARYYGTRWEMDTFLAAATIPTILFGVFNGALVSALVPAFSEYLAHVRKKRRGAWRARCSTCSRWAYDARRRRFLYRALVRAGHRARLSGTADGRGHRMTRWLMPGIVDREPERRASAMLNALAPFPRRGDSGWRSTS